MASPTAGPPPPAPSSQPPPGGQQQQQQEQLLQAEPPTKPPFKNPLIHNVALGVTPIAMCALALPPRRFDIRFLILTGCATWGIFQLRYDYTGRSLGERMSGLTGVFGAFNPGALPAEAQRTQVRIREEKARRQMLKELEGAADADRARVAEQQLLQRLAREKEEEDKKRGALEAIWMGDADEDWKEKRAKREREALQEGGGGIWGLIVDQIGDVWTQGGKKAQEKENDKEETDHGNSKKSS
jgi:hypothetical protein